MGTHFLCQGTHLLSQGDTTFMPGDTSFKPGLKKCVPWLKSCVPLGTHFLCQGTHLLSQGDTTFMPGDTSFKPECWPEQRDPPMWTGTFQYRPPEQRDPPMWTGTFQCGPPEQRDPPMCQLLTLEGTCLYWRVPLGPSKCAGILWKHMILATCLSMQNVKSKLVILNGTGWYLYLGI